MVGSTQPKVLAEFYEKIFMQPSGTGEEGWYWWQVGQCNLSIGAHSEVKDSNKEPARIILNFEVSNVKEEFERIKALGAKVVQEPYELQGAWIATFSDPDGNYFQLMPHWDHK